MKETKKTKVRGKRDFPSREADARALTEDAFHIDVDEEGLPDLTEEEQRCVDAKLYLMSQTTETGSNFYEHASHLIGNIIVDKPENAYRNLEQLSYDMKRESLIFNPSTLQTRPAPSESAALAKEQWAAFKNTGEETYLYTEATEDDAIDEDRYRIIPNLARQAYFFEQAGSGLQREEFVRVSIAMRTLVEQWPVVSIRFWGKIMGTHSNYYVAETEFQEGEYESDVSDNEDDDDDNINDSRIDKSLDNTTIDSLFDDLPDFEDIKPIVKKEVRVPCEELGTGLNGKVYFVCKEPGLPWTRLPHVTPAQIVGARKIKRFVTGDLNGLIVTYPPFPGTEKNFLRAQIARISASTTISPIGYFRFDDQEEEEEPEEESKSGRTTCVQDTEYDGFRSIWELADPTLQSWCHHVMAILPQGRNTWFNTVLGRSESIDEEDEEEDREEPDEPEPESGPPLLSPLSEDYGTEVNPAWVVRLSSRLLPEFAVSVIQSNIWPGATTFGADKGRYFESVYVGWGVKNTVTEFDPCLPVEPLWEFPSGPEISEIDDPSPEEEAAVRAALADREFDDQLANEEENDDDDDDE